MPFSYNPLLAVKLDINKKNLNDLDDVNTVGTVNGKVLTFSSGTWIPQTPSVGGDMLISQFVTGVGTVYNASRLEGDRLATVQAHNVDAGIITEGTIGLARVPAVDDARIPNLETLSYGAAFATAQVPTIGAYKVGVGTFNADRIPALPTSRIATGTFVADRIPTMENLKGTVPDSKIPDVDSLSYGGAFAGAQIPSLPTSKITTGTFNLNRIPAVDDARIPNLETLSYGGAFATAQIPDVGAYKIASGTLGLARIPGTLTGKDADTVDGADAGVAADKVFKIPAGIAQGDTFHVNAGGSVVNLSAGTTGHFLKTLGAGANPGWASVPGGGDMLKNVYDTTDNAIVDNSERLENNTLATVQAHNVAASKVTSGTFTLARIPAVDDARIPDVDTLSYGAAFATAQVPSIGAYKITTGTFTADRIPTLANLKGTVTDAKIPDLETLSYGGAFAGAQIPSLPTSKITTGTFNLNRIPAVDDARIPNLETLSYGGAFATAQIPAIGAYKITSGTFVVARHETLDNLNGTVALEQVPTMDAGHIPNLPTTKITTGTFGLARIPTMDDARIPNVDELSYGAAFATAQIPSISAYKIGLNEIHAEGTSNFAGPGGVTITHSLNLSNYVPSIVPTADAAGATGEIWITDIAVDSFVVRNSGAGVTGLTWIIHNRT